MTVFHITNKTSQRTVRSACKSWFNQRLHRIVAKGGHSR